MGTMMHRATSQERVGFFGAPGGAGSSRLQYRHTLAASWMASAQYGHVFMVVYPLTDRVCLRRGKGKCTGVQHAPRTRHSPQARRSAVQWRRDSMVGARHARAQVVAFLNYGNDHCCVVTANLSKPHTYPHMNTAYAVPGVLLELVACTTLSNPRHYACLRECQ